MARRPPGTRTAERAAYRGPARRWRGCVRPLREIRRPWRLREDAFRAASVGKPRAFESLLVIALCPGPANRLESAPHAANRKTAPAPQGAGPSSETRDPDGQFRPHRRSHCRDRSRLTHHELIKVRLPGQDRERTRRGTGGARRCTSSAMVTAHRPVKRCCTAPHPGPARRFRCRPEILSPVETTPYLVRG